MKHILRFLFRLQRKVMAFLLLEVTKHEVTKQNKKNQHENIKSANTYAE